MKRILLFLACTGALFLAACTGDSQLPNPTGKGAIRAINAIPGSPNVAFRIEERVLNEIGYKDSSNRVLYDDFEYNFNFDISVPGEVEPRRIASVVQKIDADRDYIFALTGSLDNPTVTTWAADIRDWGESESVFEARFAHLSASLGDVDVYFDDPANPPSANNLVATLSPGNIMDIRDFEEGSYAITMTAAGDPNRVPLYTSSNLNFAAQTSHVVSIFDGNENDLSPYILTTTTTTSQTVRLADPSFGTTIRIIHGSRTLQSVDVYDDETLTSLVVSDVAFGSATTDLLTTSDEKTYYFTPAGSVATTLFSQALGAAPLAAPSELFLIGTTDLWEGINLAQDRSSVSTIAKLTIYHAAFENQSFDIYVKERDAALVEDDVADLIGVLYSSPSATLRLAAGSFDIYLTEPGTKTVMAGPYPIDVALGDVVFLLAIDAVDPTLIELRDISFP